MIGSITAHCRLLRHLLPGVAADSHVARIGSRCWPAVAGVGGAIPTVENFGPRPPPPHLPGNGCRRHPPNYVDGVCRSGRAGPGAARGQERPRGRTSPGTGKDARNPDRRHPLPRSRGAPTTRPPSSEHAGGPRCARSGIPAVPGLAADLRFERTDPGAGRCDDLIVGAGEYALLTHVSIGPSVCPANRPMRWDACALIRRRRGC